VKFRISENSLYAVLMRSPWWMSFAVGAAVFALVRLFMAPAYAAFAASPFVGIGVLAAWRQLRVPSESEIGRKLEALRGLSREDFACVLEQAWRRQGYQVERFAGAGADYELAKAGRRTLVACKRWKAARTGAEPLRELAAAAGANGAAESLYVAVGEVTDSARKFADNHNIRLVQGPDLARLVPFNSIKGTPK
jgi:restriction system protein